MSYTYNTDGTLATKLDANNNTETYTYDSYGRLTAIPDRQQTFTWDTCPANAIGCVNAPGQMVQAAFYGYGSLGQGIGPNKLSFAYNYAYTPAGNVSSKTLEVQSNQYFNYFNGQQIPANGTAAASYTYDNQGALTQMSYAPFSIGLNALVLTYTLDAMERPTGLTDNSNDTWASGVTYTPANQTNLGSRTYNNLLQLTRAGQMTYSYSATKNNKQITSSTDTVTGETITYTYDALKRLASATSNQNWSENYKYDGWGNLIQMNPTGTAGAPSFSLSVALDKNLVPNNRITAAGYDNNGNSAPLGTYVWYDVANRISQVGVSPSSYYAYDSDNRHIYYRDKNNNETIYFYGADGNKLATYTVSYVTVNGTAEIQFSLAQGYDNSHVYFTGILLAESAAAGGGVTTDRLGSVRTGPGYLNFQAYPYGVEYGTGTVNDRVKYATYTRDSLTGFDYAANRYYASNWGRFLSPDLSGRSVSLKNPQTWNRYSYVGDDPVNGVDPLGLMSSPRTIPDPSTGSPAPPPDYSCGFNGFYSWINFDLTSFSGFINCPSFTTAFGYPSGDGSDGGDGGEAASPPDPNCQAELLYRPVALGAYHSYFYVVGGTAGAGEVLEGEPQHDFSLNAPTSWGLLRSVTTPGTMGDPNHPGDNATTDPNSGSITGSGIICDLVNSLVAMAGSYNASHKTTYYLAGPNSNSFASWLATWANNYLILTDYATGVTFSKPPVSVPGWGMSP